MEVISADVLVIGGGLAGLSAAILCRESGLDVLLCSKAAPGLANCTALSGGGFRSQNSGFSSDEHRSLTLKAGHHLNEPALVDTLVENGQQAIMSLSRYGVNARERSRGFYVTADKGPAGLGITRPMVDYARLAGIKFLYPFQAFEIIRENNMAMGVWGLLGKENHKILTIRSKAVILATGGGGATYLRTDNPLGATGDGYCLAYQAGLPLIDMEFVQFFPMAVCSPGQGGGNLLPAIVADVGRFINSTGENLAEKYRIDNPPLAISSRDQLSRALAGEIAGGNGVNGGIILDLNVSDKEWERARKIWGYDTDHVQRIRSRTDKMLAGKKNLLIMPTVHFFMGGVVADNWGQTDIPGLLVAGEVAGGLHGANRLGGNALTEAVVFGFRAGQKAVELARKTRSTSAGLNMAVALAEKGLARTAERYADRPTKKDIPLTEFKKNIRRLFWENIGVLRTKSLLIQAEQELERWQKYFPHIDVSGNSGLAGMNDIDNLLLLGRMLSKSALQRQESRGAHCRTDFSGKNDDTWQKHIVIRKQGKNIDSMLCETGFINRVC